MVSENGYQFNVRSQEADFLTLKTMKKFLTRRGANEESMLLKEKSMLLLLNKEKSLPK